MISYWLCQGNSRLRLSLEVARTDRDRPVRRSRSHKCPTDRIEMKKFFCQFKIWGHSILNFFFFHRKKVHSKGYLRRGGRFPKVEGRGFLGQGIRKIRLYIRVKRLFNKTNTLKRKETLLKANLLRSPFPGSILTCREHIYWRKAGK